MPSHIEKVASLTLEVVTGETCYPNENGFSSIHASTTPKSQEQIDVLLEARRSRSIITLRCAMLDTTGRITNVLEKDGKKEFIQSIEDITYRNPQKSRNEK
jgi:hypothetical protein